MRSSELSRVSVSRAWHGKSCDASEACVEKEKACLEIRAYWRRDVELRAGYGLRVLRAYALGVGGVIRSTRRRIWLVETVFEDCKEYGLVSGSQNYVGGLKEYGLVRG